MNRYRLFFTLLTAIVASGFVSASPCINTEDFKPGTTFIFDHIPTSGKIETNVRKLEREEHRLQRMESRLHKWQQRVEAKQQRIGGIADSTDRWFWFWIIGWGVGLLLTVLSGGSVAAGGLGIFWILSFAFGSFSLIMWLLKRFR